MEWIKIEDVVLTQIIDKEIVINFKDCHERLSDFKYMGWYESERGWVINTDDGETVMRGDERFKPSHIIIIEEPVD